MDQNQPVLGPSIPLTTTSMAYNCTSLNCYLVLRQIWLRVLDIDRPPRDLSKFLQFSDGLFADAYPLDEWNLQVCNNVKS